MKREIKFRAWDKGNKMMMDSDDIMLLQLPLEEVKDTNLFSFMQFTGLKDKNGKEAYFNDLVKLIGSTDIWEIKQDDFGIPVFETNAYNDNEYKIVEFKDFFQEFKRDDFEVIGNIYENPELLD